MSLSLVIFLPLLGAIGLLLIPRGSEGVMRWGALLVSGITFLLSLGLLGSFDTLDDARFQLVENVAWIPQFGVQYKVGVDGISLALILLTTLLSALAILSSWSAVTERVKEYYIALLVLETGMLGVFAALDLVLFYVFWEAMLVPMYLLIGVWGGANRIYATIKFVLYTLVGSLLMLVAIVALYLYTRTGPAAATGSFDLQYILAPENFVLGSIAPEVKRWMFLAFALAFAIKVPMWPFHTWLPDAHVEAPTAGSVILAGVLLKMGTYGFLRFCLPLFPEAALWAAPWIIILSVIGIIYGAVVAFAQEDVKKLVAYSSVSHLGFCMLGMFAFMRVAAADQNLINTGVLGSMLQSINHGLATGALFLIVGMLYERRHTREIAAFGGLWKVIPVFGALFLITTLSSIGLPGLAGFIGEFMILLGSWMAGPWITVAAASGVVLGAVYMLWMYQRVMQGPLDNPANQKLRDLNWRELWTLVPLVVLMFWIGIYPNALLRLFDQAVADNVVLPVQQAKIRQFPPALPSPGGPGPHGALPGSGTRAIVAQKLPRRPMREASSLAAETAGDETDVDPQMNADER
ncbi:MAG: NADH-quinone oxidoreductase subunit M [Armatimonadetes bacterium]|nr:NADH-quinone oxidoreductase subunit M [Armatimonadota bacterium]